MTSEKKSVLIIEDDMLIIEMVTLKLSENGYEPKFIINGKDALNAVIENDPEVIILDLMLPEVSGEEILEQLKSQSALKNIPVIVFTNKTREENEAHVLSLGAEKYLVKASTDLDTLLKTIDSLIESK